MLLLYVQEIRVCNDALKPTVGNGDSHDDVDVTPMQDHSLA